MSEKGWGLGLRGMSSRPSRRPHCFVVRPYVQGRDDGVTSELNSGKQSSGPGWTEAQRIQMLAGQGAEHIELVE